jgi:hypothetical protein
MVEIVVECNPDEALVKILGYTRKMITHQPSKGQVINYLQKNPSALGIVDEDPDSARPSYFSKFTMETNDQFGIESYYISKLGTRLIVIKPRLEEWVLRQAKEVMIDVKQHSFIDNGNELHKVINTRIPRFEGLIKEMMDKKSKGLIHLKSLIDKR